MNLPLLPKYPNRNYYTTTYNIKLLHVSSDFSVNSAAVIL